MAKSGGGDRHLQASAAGMVMIRLFLGAYFLYCGIDQLSHAAEFTRYFKGLAVGHQVAAIPGVWDYYAGFLHPPVAPGTASLAAWTIIALELLVGALLVLGFLTRLAVLIPMVANGFFFYSIIHRHMPKSETFFHECWINAGFLLMALAVLVAAAGRTWGVDAVLARRTKFKLFW